jgi:hypothetical protein
MPLEFESISHGTVAFGFFNIETDMILLNNYFLFAEDFCHSVSTIAESLRGEKFKTSWNIYLIEDREKVGNLMGAIHGVDHRGFIGEVYRRFPFPKIREEFKQKPEGFKIRAEIEDMVQNYATRTAIPILIDQKMDQTVIGEFVFSRSAFQDLIQYIWVGGFPRWREDLRPRYVLSMKEKIEQSRKSFFEGLTLRT